MRPEWQLRPSRLRLWLVALVAGAVFWALTLVQVAGPWWAAGIALLVAWACFDTWRGLRVSVRGFACREGQWYLELPSATEPVELLGYHFVSRRLGVLVFALQSGKRLRVALFPDSLDLDGHRRLAVTLA